MKRKAVKNIYIELCERFQKVTHRYNIGLLNFAEYLQTAGNTLRELYWIPIKAEAAGTITAEERQLITDRFSDFVKKEIKSTFKS